MTERDAQEPRPDLAWRFGWSSGRGAKARERAGWFHNYIGNLSLWSGYQYPEEPRFFDDAIRDLKRAVEMLSTYQPRENLADAYAYKARHASEGIEREDLLYKAERLYEAASERVRALPEDVRDRLQLRFAVSRAVAHLLLETPEGLSNGLETIVTLDDQQDPPGLLSIADRATVYNVGSCYALLDRLLRRYGEGVLISSSAGEREVLVRPRARALQYLAYALIAWPDVRRFVGGDQDFQSLRGRDQVLELVTLRSDGPSGSESDAETRADWWAQATAATAAIEEEPHGTRDD